VKEVQGAASWCMQVMDHCCTLSTSRAGPQIEHKYEMVGMRKAGPSIAWSLLIRHWLHAPRHTSTATHKPDSMRNIAAAAHPG
jgi:hypothetical protein